MYESNSLSRLDYWSYSIILSKSFYNLNSSRVEFFSILIFPPFLLLRSLSSPAHGQLYASSTKSSIMSWTSDRIKPWVMGVSTTCDGDPLTDYSSKKSSGAKTYINQKSWWKPYRCFQKRAGPLWKQGYLFFLNLTVGREGTSTSWWWCGSGEALSMGECSLMMYSDTSR